MSSLVRVSHLSKRFGSFQAVRDVSFEVQAGQVYGFLGQNGAGKSTTLRMLMTLIRPSSGSIEVFGMDLLRHRRAILRQIGAVIEKPDHYGYLSAYENLRMAAVLCGIRPTRKKLMEQLDFVGLADRYKSPVKTFSQGMKQRLGIATALVHEPSLIILDEPTNGLDPQGIADIRELIRRLSREQGKTLIVSSHLLSEIELIADSLLILHQGEKRMEGALRDLLNPAETVAEFELSNRALTDSVFASIDFIASVDWRSEQQCCVRLPKNEIPEIVRRLTEAGVRIQSVASRHSLEYYFLQLTQTESHASAVVD
ncbi:MAG: ABC transporter ATP-binding protein [Bacteroidetes bacterium]|nr:ABC transporter ATP-binding protein [Bacteroidota bacterium]